MISNTLRPIFSPRLVLVCALLLFVAACAGSEKTTTDEPEQPTVAEEPAPERAEEEDERTPRTRTVQGFRIQVLTTSEKEAADAQAGAAEAWWRNLSAQQRAAFRAQGDLPVEVAWKAPYYRVRVGAFASRGQAQQALETVTARFPEAFIVPDRVTVTTY